MPQFNYMYAAILIFSAAICLILAFFCWKRRHGTWGGWLAVLMCQIAIYSAGYAFELMSSRVDTMRFFLNIEYIGLSFMPAVIILLGFSMAGRENLITKKIIIPLFSLSAATLIIVFTTESHGLYYYNMSIDDSANFPLFAFDPGIWYWVQTVYLNISIAVLTAFVAVSFRKTTEAFRVHTKLILAGALLPWTGHIIYIAGLAPYGIDINPLFLTLTGALFALGLFRFRLLDLMPIARERVIESLEEGIIILDTQGRIVDFNNALAEIVRPVATVNIGEDFKTVFTRLPKLSMLPDVEHGKKEEIIIDAEGVDRVYEVRCQPIKNRSKTAIGKALILHEVTHKIHFIEKLENLARIDELTGAWNRRHFIELCENEVRQSKRYNRHLSMILLDIDNFKMVNDSYGHSTGDEVLKAVAFCCKKNLRDIDIFARYGGEEFAIVLPHTATEKGGDVAERLRKNIASIVLNADNGSRIFITASFGVAGTDMVGYNDIDTLFKQADKALYQAKFMGRNRVVIHTG